MIISVIKFTNEGGIDFIQSVWCFGERNEILREAVHYHLRIKRKRKSDPSNEKDETPNIEKPIDSESDEFDDISSSEESY